MSTVEVKVPDIGDFDEVPIIQVFVKAGDSVAVDDPLVELESDKATMEVPSPKSGTVKEIKVSEGDKVSEGSLLLMLEEGEADTPVDAPNPDGVQEPEAEPPQKDPAGASGGGDSGGGGGGGGGSSGSNLADVDEEGFAKAHASPSVRAFARKLGVDLGSLSGSGRKGRILRDDVIAAYEGKAGGGQAAARGGATAEGAGIPPIPPVDFSKFGKIEEVDMTRIQKISGPALHRSWLNIPHVTHHEDADITEIDAFRKDLDTEAKEQGYRVTLLSFLIKASVSALREHWQLNSSIHPGGDKFIRKHYYHIGFAADTPNGLVVPVIKDCDKKGIVEISKELGELSKKARDGKLSGDEMKGATFTISSLGGIGGTSFTPIVNAPEVAILGVTRAAMKPVWNKEKEKFKPRYILPMSLSYDHRAIDGALAARFCASLAHMLGDTRRILL